MKLGQAQAAIQEKSQTASQKILELVAEDQKVSPEGNPTDVLFALVPFSTFLVLILILCGCHGSICFHYHDTFLDQKFIGTINQRLERIQETVGRALPAIKEPGQSLYLLSFLDKPGR